MIFLFGRRFLETLNGACWRGVYDVAANDLVFIDKERGIDRFCGIRVIGYLVDVALHGFAGKLCQVEALHLLQVIIAVIDLAALLWYADLPAFCRGGVYFPTQCFQVIHSGIVGT